MNLKDNVKSFRYLEHPRINSRYYESSAGQLFVNNVNPFNTMGGHADNVEENLLNRRNNEQYIDIFVNMPSKESNPVISKEIMNEIHKNNPINNNCNEHNMFMNEKCGDDEIHETFLAETQNPFSQSMVSMSANRFNSQYTSRSRSVSKTSRYDYKFRFDEYNQDNNQHKAFSTNEMSNNVEDQNERCDKATYCYPLLNTYNQEFKTVQRNEKLQKIMRKLVVERKREKQRELWNNYINDLKNKHRYYSNEPSMIEPQYVPDDHNTPEMITVSDDFYNTRFNWGQSNPCQHLLQDLYRSHDHIPSTVHNTYLRNFDSNIPPDVGSFIFDNNNFCYPTCSQSQASRLRFNKERQGTGNAYNWRTMPAHRFHGNTIMVDNDRKIEFDKIQGTDRSNSHHTRKSHGTSKPTQTVNLSLVNEEDHKELNIYKSETVQDDKNVYGECMCNEKPTIEAKEENMEQDQNLKVSFKQEFIKSYMDAGVPQEVIRHNKGVNVSPKQNFLRKNKDLIFFNKPSKMIENAHNKPKSFKRDENMEDLQKTDFFEEKYKKVTDNITKLKYKIHYGEEDARIQSLATIEKKIDDLTKTINLILVDIKTKQNTLIAKQSAAVSACNFFTTSPHILNRQSSDPYPYRNKNYLCAMVQSSSGSLMLSEVVPTESKRHKESSTSKMDKILLEEMKKSDKVKRDIEELLNLRQEQSWQITIDIPTKERSTEVTNSLSKTILHSDNKSLVENKTSHDPPDPRVMTIAVNTDPLGLFALLRVSTETMKQFLSYVPNLNYNACLSLLPLLLPSKRNVSCYTCTKICNTESRRPSQLSDHIKRNSSEKNRDCCVCHHTSHVLDNKRSPEGLFACRYCGKRFTRAYCCELHQQSCARQRGRPHDVPSSHMLLK